MMGNRFYQRTLWFFMALFAGLLFAMPAVAAPDAGQLLEQLQKAPELPPAPGGSPTLTAPPAPKLSATPDASPTFLVKEFRITGNKVFDEDTLLAVLTPFLNQHTGFEGLREAANAITSYYVERGYLLARGVLPGQTIVDGVVEIQVVEGRIGKIDLNNQSRLSDTFVQKRLRNIPVAKALNVEQVERALLLLKDTPGTNVSAVLKPGVEPGTSDLAVEVTPGRRVEFSVNADNEGNSFTGQYRAGANLTINNPLSIGDQLQANVLSSFGGLEYRRLAYNLPVNSVGTRVGVAKTMLNYKLGGQFDALEAHGRASVDSVYVSHPLIRSTNLNLEARLGFDHKTFDDSIDTILQSTHKQVNNVVLGLAMVKTDIVYQGVTQAVATLTSGRVSGDVSSTSASGVQNGDAPRSRFSKVNVQAERLQRLDPKWILSAKAALQYSNDNLDSSEKNTLGGSSGVRAYPQTELPSDKSLAVNLELRYQIKEPLQIYGFHDIARGIVNEPASGVPARRTLSGVGVGTRWNVTENTSVSGSVAWRTSSRATSDEPSRVPRMLLQLSHSF